MEINPQYNPAEWLTVGESLSLQHRAHQWQIADWLLAGLAIKPAGEVYDAAETLFPQYTRTTLITWVSVARAYPPLSRIKALTFSHHLAVMRDESGAAGETPEAFRQAYLAKAAENNWTVRQLRDQMAHDLEVRQADKEAAEADTEEGPDETEEPLPAPARPKGRPRTAFTLASLKPHRRAQLEKLSTARRVPVDVLAQSLIEEGLDAASEEIAALDERVAAIAQAKHAPALAERRQKNAEYQRARIDALIAKFGGAEPDYLAAIAEYRAEREASGKRHIHGREFVSEYHYAAWRVHVMWDEAHAENERYERKRAQQQKTREEEQPVEVETAVAA